VQKLFSENRVSRILPSSLAVSDEDLDARNIRGRIGVGSWSTRTEYRSIRVAGADGKVLYRQDPSSGIEGWSTYGGLGRSEGDSLVGVIMQTDCKLVTGSPEWKDYTLTMQARKTSGREGLIIVFGFRDQNNYHWWNIGGWNNTASAVERCASGARSVIGSQVPMSVTTDRWYDIKVEVKGDLIRCYLDGTLVHEIADRQDWSPLYGVSGLTGDGDIIVKLVNVDSAPRPARVKILGAGRIKSEAVATVLSSASLSDTNSFDAPDLVSPKTKTFTGISDNFIWTAEAYSLTVLRLRTDAREKK
jgi:hypothetical protein